MGTPFFFEDEKRRCPEGILKSDDEKRRRPQDILKSENEERRCPQGIRPNVGHNIS
jgi:hypothetical protein